MPKILITPIAACQEAAAHVRAAGFVHVVDSTKSEATYWRFPGRWGVLRIAAHKASKSAFRGKGFGHGRVLTSVTFHEKESASDGFLRLTDEAIEDAAANAIGIYMIRAKRVEDAAGLSPSCPCPDAESAAVVPVLSPRCPA